MYYTSYTPMLSQNKKEQDKFGNISQLIGYTVVFNQSTVEMFYN